ncbi:MAG: hypothetical protein QOI53_3749 [Verrucomicrobiota bacterium]|jgi:hypothetical protein|nr:hypothetical protein [Verrucomicrobiota bacterium]
MNCTNDGWRTLPCHEQATARRMATAHGVRTMNNATAYRLALYYLGVVN